MSQRTLTSRTTGTRQHGYSLVELGVALVVLGLLVVGFVAYWRMATQQQADSAGRDLRAVAERALVGYAQSHARLPCPAADNLGNESCGTGQVGQLPWRTLGIADRAAGQLKYGVYRAASSTATPWLDTDLAVNIDRLPPLFTTAYFPPNVPPMLPTTPVLAAPSVANLIDLCYAINTASLVTTVSSTALAVATGTGSTTVRRAVAFVVASPGLNNADGSGDRFDGLQASASQASPTFDAANRARTSNDDDRVLAMSLNGLFAQLGCGPALSAISHSHVAAATAAAYMHQGIVNYERQMEINKMIADGGVAQATASVLGAAAGLADAVANSANAVAFTILTYGATAAVLAPAIASIVANTAAVVSSAFTLDRAVQVQTEAANRVTESTVLVGTFSTRAALIKTNAVAADSRGF